LPDRPASDHPEEPGRAEAPRSSGARPAESGHAGSGEAAPPERAGLEPGRTEAPKRDETTPPEPGRVGPLEPERATPGERKDASYVAPDRGSWDADGCADFEPVSQEREADSPPDADTCSVVPPPLVPQPEPRRRGSAGRVAALVYGGISLVIAATFLFVTTFTGDYPVVARFAGAAWVFTLSMIVLMPFVIPRVRSRRG
jgi:hypothetical protein